MRYFGPAVLLVVGFMNLYPMIGVSSTKVLSDLYGVDVQGPDLMILMRHRAVLFGLLGGFMVVAAFRPLLRRLATIAGLVSMLSFVILASSVGGYGEALGRIVIADIGGSAALLLSLALEALPKDSQSDEGDG